MSRLILVSNRLPVTVKVEGRTGVHITASTKGRTGVHITASTGGLATGLARPHARSGGLWIGWPGDVGHLDATQRDVLEAELAQRRCIPVHLSAEELNQYYEGFANRVLWPVFHSAPGTVPMQGRHYRTYERVNQRFADAVIALWRPGDTIWIHDYQLLLVPGMIRRALPDARIGFFLHIPFPPSEVFRMLPWRAELLQGMLGASLVGFHTRTFRLNFAAALIDLRAAKVTGDHVMIPGGGRAQLGVFPMGIDAEWFESLARRASVRAEAASMRAGARARDQALILGVDRMDYTKGIPHRLVALGRLFERRPQLRGHLRFLEVAVPSRENVAAYETVRHEVEMLTGRINSQYGSTDDMPVHFLYRSFGTDQLAALYQAADVMMVTPLRDGMNLVAKEFVACRPDCDGVLVLSEFAGAAAEMPEALLVNPYDIDQVADTLVRALEMPKEERARRMDALRYDVQQTDVHWWVAEFLSQLERGEQLEPDETSMTSDQRAEEWLAHAPPG